MSGEGRKNGREGGREGVSRLLPASLQTKRAFPLPGISLSPLFARQVRYRSLNLAFPCHLIHTKMRAGTLDVSLLYVHNGFVTVESVDGDDHLGGT